MVLKDGTKDGHVLIFHQVFDGRLFIQRPLQIFPKLLALILVLLPGVQRLE
jgi:hypothetical protein